MTNQRGSIIPAIAFIFGAAVVVLIFGYMLWPKASDLPSTGPVIVKNTNAVNGNAAVNTNADSTKNTLTPKTIPQGWLTFNSTTFDDAPIIEAKRPALALAYPSKYAASASIDTISLYATPGDTTKDYINFDWGRSIASGSTPESRCADLAHSQYANYTTQENKNITIDDQPAKFLRLLLNADNGQFKVILVCGTTGSTRFDLLAHPDTSASFVTDLETLLQTISFSTTSPTAGWKTYTNQKYHFLFRYPPNWKLTEDFTIDGPLDGTQFAVADNAGKNYFSVCPEAGFYCRSIKDQDAVRQWETSDADVIIAGRSATRSKVTCTGAIEPKFESGCYRRDTVQFRKVVPSDWSYDNWIYLSNGLSEDMTVVDQILSTFTFTQD
ncbi:MAG: hypothetical protein HY567_04350 [Candidatus Kerfeldbacteria bacterium]|nr:hypothetical protein [Candidatus Kerfeldbacteria bacterium]